MAHEALVIGPGFGRLHPVGPDGGPPGGLLEAAHVLPEAVVLGLLELLEAVKVLLPGGVISRLDLDVRPVQGQDVVHAAVQEAAVVGHQDKAPLPLEVGRNQLPPLGVQVVGGLVNKGEAPLPEEQGRQEDLGPLPVGEGGEGPP